MPLPHSPLDWALLQRLTKRSNEADEQIVREWAASDPRHAQIVEELEHAFGSLDSDLAQRDAAWRDGVWRALVDRTQNSADALPRPTSTAGLARSITKRQTGTGTGWFARHRMVPIGVLASLGIALAIAAPRPTRPPSVRTYVTATGQEATLRLADGTSVTLAPQSVLRVSDFDGKSRTVELNGEAFFNVVTTTGTPFVVRTNAATTRVLGTSFFVRQHATDGNVQVAVRSGKVMVVPNAAPALRVALVAGQLGTATDSTIASDSDGARYADWIDGEIVFRKASVTEVLTTLSRWYGYDFRLADSALAHEKLTVSISTKSSANALTTLKLYLDVDLVFDGKVVTLRRREDVPVLPRSRRERPDPLFSPTREVGR